MTLVHGGDMMLQTENQQVDGLIEVEDRHYFWKEFRVQL